MEDNETHSRPYDSVWCPHARIGMGRTTPQGVEMIPAPGYNIFMTYRSPEDTKPALSLVARCQGPACPHYIGPRFGRRMRCGLGEWNSGILSDIAVFLAGFAAVVFAVVVTWRITCLG